MRRIEEDNESTEEKKQELSPLAEYQQMFTAGVKLYECGDYEDAAKSFNDTYQKFPEQTEVLVNYGNCLYELAQTDKAVECWLQAKEKDKYLINTYINLGNYYLASEKFSEAVEEFLFALAIEPQNENIIANLSIAYEKSNNKRKAYLYYDYFLSTSKNLTSRNYKSINRRTAMNKINAVEQIKLGINYEKRGVYRKALQTYYNSLRLYPNFPKTYINIGNIFYRLEKYEFARLYWMEAFKIEPNNIKLCINLALCCEKLEDFLSAYSFYVKFIKQTSHSSSDNIAAQTAAQKLYAEIMLTNDYVIKYKEKAEELFEQKNYEDALFYYENLRLFHETSDIIDKINTLRIESNIMRKAAFVAYEMAKIAFEKKDYDTTIHRCKSSLNMWQNSFFEKNINILLEESQKARNNSMVTMIQEQKRNEKMGRIDL